MIDLQKIFSEDPLNLTRTDIDEIIKYYREKRSQWLQGDKTAGKIKKEKKDPGPNISLDDIVL